MQTHIHMELKHRRTGTIHTLVCKVESSTYGTIINLDSIFGAVAPPASH